MEQLLRGTVQVHMLDHAAEDEIHGTSMSAESARHGHRISPGTPYPTLRCLEAERLLPSRKTVVDGRARRVYVVTEDGRRARKATRRALRELADEVLD